MGGSGAGSLALIVVGGVGDWAKNEHGVDEKTSWNWCRLVLAGVGLIG